MSYLGPFPDLSTEILNDMYKTQTSVNYEQNNTSSDIKNSNMQGQEAFTDLNMYITTQNPQKTNHQSSNYRRIQAMDDKFMTQEPSLEFKTYLRLKQNALSVRRHSLDNSQLQRQNMSDMMHNRYENDMQLQSLHTGMNSNTYASQQQAGILSNVMIDIPISNVSISATNGETGPGGLVSVFPRIPMDVYTAFNDSESIKNTSQKQQEQKQQVNNSTYPNTSTRPSKKKTCKGTYSFHKLML
jgi:hypothetical protein